MKQRAEKGVLLLLECQAAPEKDFWVWEKNVNVNVKRECSGVWGLLRKPLEAEGIIDHVGPG